MTAILSEHLSLLINTPDGIRKLRSLILDLAMQGKLVQQNAEDEPASEILKRISSERARLETEGTCRKTKPLPVLGDEERPHKLPPSWVWTRLGEVTNFGQTDKNGEVTERTWVLDLEDIQKDTSVLLKKVRFAERQAKSDKNRFRSGDVLYGKLRPYLNKVIVADEDGICTTEVLPVRGFCGLVPRFLMHALKRSDFLAYVNLKSYGMKMPRLGTEDGRLAVFPLPPEAEQRRIVAKVDELMALCDRLEAEQTDAEAAHAKLIETLLDALTQSTDAGDFAANWQRLTEHFDTLFTTGSSIDALKQTILQLAVMGKLVPQDPHDEPSGELLKRIAQERARLEEEGIEKRAKPMPAVEEEEHLYDLPTGWKWGRFGAVATVIGNLVDSLDFPDSIQIAPDCIEKRTGRLIERRTVREAGVRGPNQRFKAGQLLYSKIRPSLSKAVLVDFDGLCSADMYPLNSFIAPRFLLLQILSETFLQQVRSAENRVKMPKLNQESLNAFLICVPPLAEQHRIVAKVDELTVLCDRLKAVLVESRARQEHLASNLIKSTLKAA